MGGSRSGRTGGFPTSEACASLVLSTTDFLRAGLRQGCKGTMRWRIWLDGQPFPIFFHIDTTSVHGSYVEFVHRPRKADRTIQRYNVHLTRTPQRFGGFRWWFQCPYSGKRAVKLFLPLGGYRFWCREAYRLGYASQREDAKGRAQLQAERIYRRLGGNGHWMDDPPPKPKWMRWRTYDRQVARLEQNCARFDNAWSAGIGKLMSRSG